MYPDFRIIFRCCDPDTQKLHSRCHDFDEDTEPAEGIAMEHIDHRKTADYEINEQTMVMEGHVEGMIVHETVTIEKREAEYNYESGFLMLT